jgi:hypothetical protein
MTQLECIGKPSRRLGFSSQAGWGHLLGRVLRAFPVLLGCLFAVGDAFCAQEVQVWAGDIQLVLQAKGAPLKWHLERFPDSTDITSEAEEFRRYVLSYTSRFGTELPSLDDYRKNLKRVTEEFIDFTPDMSGLPVPTVVGQSVVFTMGADLRAPEPTRLEKIVIELPGARLAPVDIARVLPHLALGLSAEEFTNRFQLMAPVEAGALPEEFWTWLGSVLQRVMKAGWRPNAPTPVVASEGALTQLKREITAQPDMLAGSVQVNTKFGSQDRRLVLQFISTPLIREIWIEIPKFPDEEEAEAEIERSREQGIQEAPANAAYNVAALSRRRQVLAKELWAKVGDKLTARVGGLATATRIDADLVQIRQESQVEKVTPQLDRGLLTYLVDYKPDVRSVRLVLRAGYSTLNNATLGVGLQTTNLLGFGGRLALNLEGGPDLQRVALNGFQPWDKPDTTLSGQFTAGGEFDRRPNQRLGQLAPGRVEERRNELHLQHSLIHGSLDRMGAASRFQHRQQLDTELSWGETDLRSSADLIDGRTTIASVEGRSSLQYEAPANHGAGVDLLTFGVKIRAEKAFAGMGGDFDFNRLSVHFQSEYAFRVWGPEDLLLRYGIGGGATSDRTPAMEQFRLGSSFQLRGMRDGEFIGRTVSYDRAELGANVEFLAKLLRIKDRSEAPTSAHSNLPFALNQILLKLFVDRARVLTESSMEKMLTFDLDQLGYGIAVEIRNLGNGSLSLGYGYSPDSTLERSGMFIVSFSQRF